MNRTLFLAMSFACFAAPNLLGQDQDATQAPLASIGSFSLSLNSADQLTVDWALIKERQEQLQGTRTVCKTVMEQREQTYSVDVGGRTEQRTRTIDLPRQIQERVQYTYTHCVPYEEKQRRLQSPKLFRLEADGAQVVTGTTEARRIIQEVNSTDTATGPQKCFFVSTAADAEKLAETFSTKLGGVADLTDIRYIVATDEFQLLVRDETPIATVATLIEVRQTPDGLNAICDVRVPYTEQMTGTRTVSRTVLDSQEKDGKTIKVRREVREQVPYTYTVKKDRSEQRIFPNASVLTTQNGGLVELSNDDEGHYPTGTTVFVVDSREDAYKAFLSIRHDLNLQIPDLAETIDTTGLQSAIGPTFLITTQAAKNNSATTQPKPDSMPSERRFGAPAPPAKPAAAISATKSTWPLPTEKDNWVNSLPYSPKLLDGKAMVLWFYEESCPRCQKKWSEVERMTRYFSGRNVVFAAVNSGNSRDQVSAYAKRVGAQTAIIVDADRSLEKAAGVGEITLENIYQLVVLAPNGKLYPTGTLDLKVAGDQASKLAR